ncbi:amidase [Paraburkholderia hayleyella]|uniref:amidase n=1 Tax=Paraburkholderia hayleyella TaxID=2152889 RepID=UPI0012913202|nr:amidase family protein [Paraburkholderia hayleyella]
MAALNLMTELNANAAAAATATANANANANANATAHSKDASEGVNQQAVARAAARATAHPDRAHIYLRERFAAAHDEALARDQLAALGVRLPLDGLTLTVKACFDVAGWVTDAASAVFAGRPAARADAPAVAQLRHHGATLVGHSNMTEFAFGALGVNSTTGTPRTPLDPERQRIAGGSTSGGAVAVAEGLADLALGSDTSGSVRIPAAFCGIVGFKPSSGRISTQGLVPLSSSFDVPGLIARDVTTLLRASGVFGLTAHDTAHDTSAPRAVPDLSGLRLALPLGFAREQCDAEVLAAFDQALHTLHRHGAQIVPTAFTDLHAPARIALESGIIVAEAYALHQPWIHDNLARYDARVGPRILQGEHISAPRYLQGKARLQALAQRYDEEIAPFDALLTPTVPLLPPRLAELDASEAYLRLNARSFSLTELANRIDAPSLSLPLHLEQNPTPCGLLLTGRRQHDASLLALALRLEQALAWSAGGPERQPA